MDKVLKPYLEELTVLTRDNQSVKVRNYLNDLPKTIKGDVFEEYLTLLYEHNSLQALRVGNRGDAGGDILLFNEDEDFCAGRG